jgi:organic hydroperoxide reductase OsmC/OhrA
MEPVKHSKSFQYQNEVRWNSERLALLSAPGKPDLRVSSPPEFHGEPGCWTPEDMLVASVNACLLLTFVAYCVREDLAILCYECSAQGTLEDSGNGYQFSEIVLRPRIGVKSDEDLELANFVLDTAQTACIVSRSIKPAVKVLARFDVTPSAP